MQGQAKVTLLLELKNKMKAGITSANKFLNENIKNMKDRISSLKKHHIEAFQSMRNEIPMLDRAMNVLANPYTKIIAGATALIMVYAKSSAMAAHWSKDMAKANVTAQLSKTELKGLSNTLLEIGASKDNTGDLMDVPLAFNKILSAGLDTNSALKALVPTLHAAKAGFTDIETVAGAGVSVMNSSGVKDITKVYDILFATLNKGNAEFSDIAQYLPKIIPGARQAGASLEEVAGAYAYLTAQGMSAEQSATSLQNVFKALSDQQIIFGTSTKKGMKGLGIDVFDATGKMRPLLDIITQLKTKMQGLNDSQKVSFLDQIGFDMEAGSAIASMTQDTEKLKGVLDFTANSGGQLAAAMENAKLSGESWTVMGNTLKKTMIEIGQPVNETFGKLGDELLPLVQRGLVVAKDIFIGIWEILSEVGKLVWAIAKPIAGIILDLIEWIKSTGILQTAFEVVKTIVSAIASLVKLIVDGLKWVADKFGKSPEQIIREKEEEMKRKEEPTEFTYTYEEMKASGKIVEEQKPLMPTGGTGKGTPFNVTGTKTPKSGETSVSGKAQQVRNITINIGNLSNVEQMNVKGDDGKPMSKVDFEAYMKEMLVRLLRGVETSYN